MPIYQPVASLRFGMFRDDFEVSGMERRERTPVV
jgi:hypothetical protein